MEGLGSSLSLTWRRPCPSHRSEWLGPILMGSMFAQDFICSPYFFLPLWALFYIRIPTHIHTHAHSYIFTHLHTFTHIQTFTHIYTHLHTHTYIHTVIHILTFTYRHVHSHIHTLMYRHSSVSGVTGIKLWILVMPSKQDATELHP